MPGDVIDGLAGVSPEDRARLREWTRGWDHRLKPVVFVGAGLSAYCARRKPTAPPDATIKAWEGLAQDFVDALRVDGAPALTTDPLRLAELVKYHTSRTRLLDIVQAAVPDQHFDPGLAHEHLTKLPWAAVITTNYDDLIERAYSATTYPTLVVVDDTDLTRPRDPEHILLIKMHGDLRRRPSIVITEEDYRCYEDRSPRPDQLGRPGIALKVRQLLLEHPVLFLGYGLADPNVGRLLGWVRDIVGRLQLPAIVVVHREPRRAERELWADRGVHLVHVDGSGGGDLALVLDAIWKVRSKRGGTAPPSAGALLNAAVDTVSAAVKKPSTTSADAERVVATLIEAAAAEGPEATPWNAMRNVSQLASTGTDVDWPAFLGKLSLRSLTKLATLLAPTRYFIVRPGLPVDLRVALFAFADIPEERRAGWFLEWLDDRLDGASHEDLAIWLRQLSEWRRKLIGEVGASVERAIGDIVFLRSDVEELRTEAHRVVASPSARDFCRAGCAFLALDDRQQAAERFRLAHDVARTPDDRYAALVGLAVAEPKDEVFEELGGIPAEQAPQSTSLQKLGDDAARELLRRGASEGASEASMMLVKYCREARRANWPIEYSSVRTAARRATTLLLEAADEPATSVARAIGLRIEFGLADDTERDVEMTAMERVTTNSATRDAVRRLILRPGLAPASYSAQQALSELAFDLLDDNEITSVVARLIADTTNALEQNPARWNGRLQDRWKCLEVARQRLTTAALVQVAAVLPTMCDRRWRNVEHLGIVTSSLLGDHRSFRQFPEFVSFVAWIASRVVEPRVSDDWYRRRRLLDAATRVHESFSIEQRTAVASALNDTLERLTGKAPENEDSHALDILGYFAATKETPRQLEREIARLIAIAPHAGRSTLSGAWAWVTEKLGAHPGEARLADLRRCAFDVAATIARLQTQRDDPFAQALDPVDPLRTLVAVALAQAAPLTGVEVALIERVGEARASALALLARDGIGIGLEMRDRARDRLVAAAIGQAGSARTRAARGVVEWCTHQVPDAGMQDVLLSLLTLGEWGERRTLAGSVWELRRGQKLSEELWTRVARRVLDATQSALPPIVRAQATRSLKEAARGTLHEAEAEARLVELNADRDTIVRRAAAEAQREGVVEQPAANQPPE